MVFTVRLGEGLGSCNVLIGLLSDKNIFNVIVSVSEICVSVFAVLVIVSYVHIPVFNDFDFHFVTITPVGCSAPSILIGLSNLNCLTITYDR